MHINCESRKVILSFFLVIKNTHLFMFADGKLFVLTVTKALLALFAGTIQGRPLVESEKLRYTITARNEVNSTDTVIELQVLVPPSNFEYTYPSVIYKVGQLDCPAW